MNDRDTQLLHGGQRQPWVTSSSMIVAVWVVSIIALLGWLDTLPGGMQDRACGPLAQFHASGQGDLLGCDEIQRRVNGMTLWLSAALFLMFWVRMSDLIFEATGSNLKWYNWFLPVLYSCCAFLCLLLQWYAPIWWNFAAGRAEIRNLHWLLQLSTIIAMGVNLPIIIAMRCCRAGLVLVLLATVSVFHWLTLQMLFLLLAPGDYRNPIIPTPFRAEVDWVNLPVYVPGLLILGLLLAWRTADDPGRT